MGMIAESAGCFAYSGRDGKIYFKHIGQDEAKIPLEYFKTYKFGEEYSISKVAYEDGIRSFKYGDETRNTLWISQDNMFIIDEEQIGNVYNEVKELTINSFEGTTIIDPSIDIGDKLIVGDKTIIYQGEISLSGRFIADIRSKISIKQKEETTVRKESQTAINRRVQSKINQIDGTITQLVEETTEHSDKIAKQEIDIDSVKTTVSETETRLANEYLTAEQIEAENNSIKEGLDIIKQQQASMELTSAGLQVQINSINNEGVKTVKNTLVNIDEEGIKVSKGTEFNSLLDDTRRIFKVI